MKHNIRPAEFHDAEHIFRLVRNHPEELLPRALSNIAQNIDRFLVCEKDNKVVGTVSWQILPEIGMPQNPSVEIKSLAVDNSCRGEGVGKALVEGALERIRPLHPCQVLVLTFHSDFFRKLGFVEVPKEDIMHRIYTGCINCTKYDSPFTCPEIAMVLDLQTS